MMMKMTIMMMTMIAMIMTTMTICHEAIVPVDRPSKTSS